MLISPLADPSPRRSPYAGLLKNIVDAGKAAQDRPDSESETEFTTETSDTGSTARLDDLQTGFRMCSEGLPLHDT
jgi:hypothetical protein